MKLSKVTYNNLKTNTTNLNITFIENGLVVIESIHDKHTNIQFLYIIF